MNPDNLHKFLARARRGGGKAPEETPFGFATRVAARWTAGASPSPMDALFLWERLSRWALIGACAVCFTVFLVGRNSVQATAGPSALEAFAGLAGDDDSF